MKKMLRYPAVRLICWYLAFTFSGFLILPVTAQAGFISPSEGTLAEMDVDVIATVREALEKGVLTEKLTALGLSADEITARLDALTPDERQAVLADMEQIQAGGNGLVTLLVIVALVLLILHLTDKKIKIE
jgi:hypothetical protein